MAAPSERTGSALSSFLIERWSPSPYKTVFGDTHDAECCKMLQTQLDVIRADDYLRIRLQHLFVCVESADAETVIASSGLPITRYRRGDWNCRDQRLARQLSESIYHYGSTLTNAVNLALLLNPGQDVRLCGCQYGHRAGHFYSLAEASDADAMAIFPRVIQRMWEGFSDMLRAGVGLIDCNFEHDGPLPYGVIFPRKSLIEGLV